jgi:putative ABC transport system permease protein
MTPTPRFSRRLLSVALPASHRRVMLADLDEEFEHRTAATSAASAAWWYRRQVIASLPGAVRIRARFQVGDLIRDARYSARMLRRNPTFAATVILTLTIGIGAASAMLTLTNAVLVRPLPYADPGRIVSVLEMTRDKDVSSGNLSWPDYVDYSTDTQTLASMAVYTGDNLTLTRDGAAAERVPAVEVSGRFFDVLGVKPTLGRVVEDADMRQGAVPVVLLTSAAWRTRFGGDPAVLGRNIALDGVSTTIIGVLPADFEFPPRGQAEIWLPLQAPPAVQTRRAFHWLDAIARLRPGVTSHQANADLDRIAAGFASVDPRGHQHTFTALPVLRDRIVGDVKPVLLVLTSSAVLVLLVACANIGGLLLAQNATRTTELSVRNVMGAGRSRLLRQLLTENVMLALPGGLLGILLGQAMVNGLIAALPPAQRLTLPHIASLSIDGQALGISLALTLSASVLFGLLPAWRSVRSDRLQATRGVASQGVQELRLQSVFVVVQVALALILLAGAGLMAQSVRRLLNVSPGFRADHLLTATVALPQDKYKDAGGLRTAHADLLARVSSLPGVLGAALIDQLPLSGSTSSGSVAVVGDPSARETTVLIRAVSANYFETMGVPLRAGRTFASSDLPSGPPIVIVNQLFADMVLGSDLQDRRVVFPARPNAPLTIVGVVANEQFESLDAATKPVLYLPATRLPAPTFSLVLRTAGPPEDRFPSLVADIGRFDSSITVFKRATMDQLVNRSPAVFRRRSVLMLIAGFAAAAIILAGVGLYGVLAQVVAQRTREIGVRLALGAAPGTIARSVIRRGLIPVAGGLVVGLGGSVLMGHYLTGLLFGTAATDPVALGIVVVVLCLAAAIACFIPTRRALRVDPVVALRDGEP